MWSKERSPQERVNTYLFAQTWKKKLQNEKNMGEKEGGGGKVFVFQINSPVLQTKKKNTNKTIKPDLSSYIENSKLLPIFLALQRKKAKQNKKNQQ